MVTSSRTLCVIASLFIVLPVAESVATQWLPRLDLGVAAVDRQSGELLWEAWNMHDVPQDASKELKEAAKQLLANPENYEYDKAPGQVAMPASLTMTQFVRYAYKDLKHQYILTHGSPKEPGEEIARFASKDQPGWPIVSGGGTMYFLLRRRVHAMKTWDKEEPPLDGRWRPTWTYDLRPDLKFEEKDRARQYYVGANIDRGKFWVVHPRGMLRLNGRGKKEIAFEIERPWEMIWNGFGTPVSFGDRHIYYRHGNGVIALDKNTGDEKWRFLTTRSPYPSRVAEVDDDLVLVQVGSDTPPTIKNALADSKSQTPTLLKETTVERQVAAAKLIRAYGDGYYRAKLAELAKKWRADGREIAAANEVEALLKNWPNKRDRQRLIDTVVKSLVEKKKSQRLFTWATLQGLLYLDTPDTFLYRADHYAYDRWKDQSLGLDNATMARLTEHCRDVIASGQDQEKAFAASVLVSREVGWSNLSDTDLKQLFTSNHRGIWRWTALALLKNDRRQTLLQWASLRPDDEQIDIIYALSQRWPKSMSDLELKFWVECSQQTPALVANSLYFSAVPANFTVPAALRKPIRSYLEKEIAKPTVFRNSHEENHLSTALTVVHQWDDPQDTLLFLKYLTHPDRNEVYVSGGKKYVYRIRNNAKHILEQRGVALPAGIAYEEPKK